MAYYIRKRQDLITEPWCIDHSTAFRVDILSPEQSPGAYFKADPGENIFEAIRRNATGWFTPSGISPFHKVDLEPGQCYPRIARPIEPHIENPARNPTERRYAETIAIASGQLLTLTRQLDRICQTVHPDGSTLKVYGHDIRNLLILACTEVEAQCRGVLVANGMKLKQFNIGKYSLVSQPMRLDEYAVLFPKYPWLHPIDPFYGWCHPENIKHFLPWWHAYNKVKHDREGAFSEATLENAFLALSACIVLMAAQFGENSILRQHAELAAFFQITARPIWRVSECYINPYSFNQGKWTHINLDF